MHSWVNRGKPLWNKNKGPMAWPLQRFPETPGEQGKQSLKTIWMSLNHLRSPPLLTGAKQPMASTPVHNRILIADDDALVRGSLAAVLESEGYIVFEAGNGIDAVRRAMEHIPDLVLLDLDMPDWDGWTTFSQLAQSFPLLPVILITAHSNQYGEALRLGADAFMEKPFNIPVLLRTVKGLSGGDNDHPIK
jgi:CheY-like chemotaxis protein